ncbi:hypothetical protein BDP27DRAFT_1366096 [Rhodocollybia butyracea]|uniref:Uncharacterized protein n=1 Tax=Rhodocollybia butyracea TaxID=206335 RepID=A0A9P5PME5_9AGAR|nr:hypothetical protein BDP27DRAFT_1366096 [Rhodocollybia butyracea]
MFSPMKIIAIVFLAAVHANASSYSISYYSDGGCSDLIGTSGSDNFSKNGCYQDHRVERCDDSYLGRPTQIATTTSGRFRHNAQEETHAFPLPELIRLGSKWGVFEISTVPEPYLDLRTLDVCDCFNRLDVETSGK